MNLKEKSTPHASVTGDPDAIRLALDPSDTQAYRCAQLDDYDGLPRGQFPHHSLTLQLSARVSSPVVPGTWGFGLWNDPFGFSIGFGGSPLRIPALPNAAWFFFASPESHLSFSDDLPGSGFLAQVFRSPRLHPKLIPAGFTFPFSPRKARRQLSRVIQERSAPVPVRVTDWHTYRLAWNSSGVRLEVDGRLVLDTQLTPRGPLGLVVWIDNQFAAFRPDGKIGFGILENPEPVSLEISGVEISD